LRHRTHVFYPLKSAKSPKTKLEPQIPAHAENDDFPVKMAALEKFINAQHAGSGPLMARSPANMPRFRYLHQSHWYFKVGLARC
jgi:hypothetical protein